MTNKIEQKFFECFGIKPKRYEQPSRTYDNDGEVCEYYINEIYPPITDRILLEFICILSKTGSLEFNGVCSVEEIKEELLKTLIEYKKEKHKIQQLFKEYE